MHKEAVPASCIKRQYLHGGPQHAHQKEIKRQYLHGGPQHAHPLELGE
jgi:hypothetical protein